MVTENRWRSQILFQVPLSPALVVAYILNFDLEMMCTLRAPLKAELGTP